MKPVTNELGFRNSFGYYDNYAREIVLKRPCPIKADILEAFTWIEEAEDLKKFSIGLGGVDSFLINDYSDNLYGASRNVVRNSLVSNSVSDKFILENVLTRLVNKSALRNLGVKCFMFSGNRELFEMLVKVIKSHPNLVYLDLTGSYFDDDQLIYLAGVISSTYIANLVWPEPRMSPLVFDRVLDNFKSNKSIVVIDGAPLEMHQFAQKNREWLFSYARYPSLIKEEEIAIVRQYRESARIGIAYEKQQLYDLDKTIEALIA